MAKAMINPSPAQRLERDLERIETLKDAITRAEAKGNAERVASLQAEVDKRKARIAEVKAMLADV